MAAILRPYVLPFPAVDSWQVEEHLAGFGLDSNLASHTRPVVVRAARGGWGWLGVAEGG